MTGERLRRRVGLLLDLLRVAPLVVVGVSLLWLSRVVVREAPPVPATAILALWVGLRGVLNVVAPLWFVDGFAAVARHVWPALDVAVAGGVLLWFSALPHRARMPMSGLGFRWLVLLLTAGSAFVVAAWPGLYWGDAASDGVLFWLNGVKFVCYGIVAVSFLRAYAAGWGGDWARSGLWLAVALSLDVMHWVTTDLLWVELTGVALTDVRPAPDHWMRLVALFPVAALLVLLAVHGWTHQTRAVRRGCRAALAGLLVPALLSVVALDLFVFGALSAAVANDVLVLWLDALWTGAFVFIVFMVVRFVPDGVQAWLGSDAVVDVVESSTPE